MLAVSHVGHGVLEVNYMWLPTWVGLNSALLKEIGEHVQGQAVGKPLDEATMLAIHLSIVDFLCHRFPSILGLRSHLDGLLLVELPEYDAPDHEG